MKGVGNMLCKHAIELMNASIDHEITDSEMNELNLHLESCEACTIEYEEIKYLIELLDEEPLAALPVNFNKTLHAKLVAEKIEMDENELSKENQPKDKIILKFARSNKFKIIASTAAVIAVAVILTNGPFSVRMGNGGSADTVSSEKNYSLARDENIEFDFSESIESTESTQAAMTEPMAEDSYSVAGSGLRSTDSTYREGRILIQSANIELSVENYDFTLDEMKKLVDKQSGYIANEETGVYSYTDNQEPMKSGYVVLKVPSENFDSLVESIGSYGKITYESYTKDDYTDVYRDTASEIENLKITEERLREILKKADTVEDILSIEMQLTNVRSQINDYTRQIKNWEKLSDLSTISLNIVQVKTLNTVIEPLDYSIWSRAKVGFIESINTIVTVVENFVVWLIGALPVLGIIAIVSWIARVIYKKKKKN